MNPTKQQLIDYMTLEAESCRDQETGEISPTKLAENTSSKFGREEWLNDETNQIWEIAIKVVDFLDYRKELS
jgi:hypothetical protein